MTTPTQIKAREQHTKDLLPQAQRDRRRMKVRRVAVVRPAGSHFKLLPIGASLRASGH